MFRIAKPESFLFLTPNRAQVGKQNAAECTPLIFEPASAFYKGPLLVLDFQSLYPSVMIAYNYCYSYVVLLRFAPSRADPSFAGLVSVGLGRSRGRRNSALRTLRLPPVYSASSSSI